MTDDSTTPNDANGDGSGSPRGWMIAVVVGLVVALIGVIVLVATDGDDSDDESVTTDSASAATTESPATTETPETTETPVSTDAPETTATPASTDRPETTEAPVDPELTFTIVDIDDGGTIPENFTCDGPNDVPVLTVTAVPEGTQQLALIMDDADAPTPDPFVHWVVYGIAADATEITDGNDDFTYGLNDTGTAGWFGPCPPPGDGPHGYVFKLYALDAVIELPEDLDGRELATAIEPAVMLEADISATYERE
jgi:Raf kinase inhibitor-like YbhB/YbcL family protein